MKQLLILVTVSFLLLPSGVFGGNSFVLRNITNCNTKCNLHCARNGSKKGCLAQCKKNCEFLKSLSKNGRLFGKKTGSKKIKLTPAQAAALKKCNKKAESDCALAKFAKYGAKAKDKSRMCLVAAKQRCMSHVTRSRIAPSDSCRRSCFTSCLRSRERTRCQQACYAKCSSRRVFPPVPARR